MTMGTSGYDTRNLSAGTEVYGSDGEKIGTLVEAGANYLLVQKGWLFIKDLYLPTSSIASFDDAGRLYLSYTKHQAEEMGREQLPTEGDAWYGTTTGTATTARTGRAAYGTDREVRKGENATVPVVEEQLKAGVREHEAGKARIVKDVREERQTLDVPVEREEVYITERKVDRPATQADMAMRDREIDIPLKEQEVVTSKEARVTGEVNVRKEVKRDTERVSDTVRREDVHVEGAETGRVHTQDTEVRRGAASGGTGKTVTDKREYDSRGKLVDKEHYEEPGMHRGR